MAPIATDGKYARPDTFAVDPVLPVAEKTVRGLCPSSKTRARLALDARDRVKNEQGRLGLPFARVLLCLLVVRDAARPAREADEV